VIYITLSIIATEYLYTLHKNDYGHSL